MGAAEGRGPPGGPAGGRRGGGAPGRVPHGTAPSGPSAPSPSGPSGPKARRPRVPSGPRRCKQRRRLGGRAESEAASDGAPVAGVDRVLEHAVVAVAVVAAAACISAVACGSEDAKSDPVHGVGPCLRRVAGGAGDGASRAAEAGGCAVAQSRAASTLTASEGINATSFSTIGKSFFLRPPVMRLSYINLLVQRSSTLFI